MKQANIIIQPLIYTPFKKLKLNRKLQQYNILILFIYELIIKKHLLQHIINLR